MVDQDTELFERHADFCKMFSNPKRLQILHLLKAGELTVGEISEQTDIAQPTVSQHLRKMRDQGVVRKRDVGVHNYYTITDDRIVDGMETMREVLVDRLSETAAVSETQR